MSKIIGVTVGTPTSPAKIADEIKPVKTVNGVEPDEKGNVEVEGGGSGLPPVTEADNGKIPRVVDGAWAVVDLPIYDGENEVM